MRLRLQILTLEITAMSIFAIYTSYERSRDGSILIHNVTLFRRTYILHSKGYSYIFVTIEGIGVGLHNKLQETYT